MYKCVVLYTVGLLVSWVTTGGDSGRAVLLATALSLFWIVWLIGRFFKRADQLYFVGLGLVLTLAIVGVAALPSLDDEYLRLNNLSHKAILFVKHFVPPIDALTMHRNTLAGMVAVFGTLALTYSLLGRRWWEKVIAGLATLNMFATLLITNSRGGLVAFGAGVLFLAVLMWHTLSPKFRWILCGTGVSFATLAGIYLVISGQYRLFSPERLLNENGAGRWQLWQDTLYMLGDVPLTGFGPGKYRWIYPFYADPYNPSLANYQEHAHNLFLQTYAELGLLAFLAVVWLALLWLVVAWRVLRNKISFATANPPVTYYKVTLIGGLASLGAMLVYGFTEHSTWNGQFAVLFWLPFGLIAASIPLKEVQLLDRVKLPRQALNRRPVQIGVGLAGLIIFTFFSWQVWGLAGANAASLEKLDYWQGNKTAKLERVAKLYNDSLSVNSWHDAPLRGMAWVAIEQGNLEQAEPILRRLLARNPQDKAGLLTLGDILAQKGQKADALAMWREAKAASVFLWRGRRLLDSPQDVKAEPFLLQAVEIDPYLWEGYTFLVMLYQRHGRTTDSIALLERAAVYFPNDSRLTTELAKLKT
jgi:O-antigen ligase